MRSIFTAPRAFDSSDHRLLLHIAVRDHHCRHDAASRLFSAVVAHVFVEDRRLVVRAGDSRAPDARASSTTASGGRSKASTCSGRNCERFQFWQKRHSDVAPGGADGVRGLAGQVVEERLLLDRVHVDRGRAAVDERVVLAAAVFPHAAVTALHVGQRRTREGRACSGRSFVERLPVGGVMQHRGAGGSRAAPADSPATATASGRALEHVVRARGRSRRARARTPVE